MTARFLMIVMLFGAGSVLLAGCARSSAEQPGTTGMAEAAVHKAGHGIRLGDAAKRFSGLDSAEVEWREAGDRAAYASIPGEALLRTARGEFVYVANGEWWLRTPVRTGARGQGRVEIVDGLYEGDVVARSGVDALWLAEIHAINGGVACSEGH